MLWTLEVIGDSARQIVEFESRDGVLHDPGPFFTSNTAGVLTSLVWSKTLGQLSTLRTEIDDISHSLK